MARTGTDTARITTTPATMVRGTRIPPHGVPSRTSAMAGPSPGESTTGLFRGNSNWRGPVWFPVNYLLIEALQRYHHFYGDELQVECPTGSGRWMSLAGVASELSRRLASLFLPGGDGHRPCHGGDARFVRDSQLRELVRFNEYFDGESGRGLGASFQGWTLLVTRCLEELAKSRVAELSRREAG